jgi:hypothetical protein
MLSVEVHAKRVERAKARGLEAVLILVVGGGLDLAGQGQELFMPQERRIPRLAHRTAGITIV